ncbi:MAG: PEP-CTERM sorting domain-containing protein [Akkermansia sp.]
MKKTLITLLALSTGVASAALTEIADMDTLVQGMTAVGSPTTVDGYNQTVYNMNGGAYVNGTAEAVINALKGSTGVVTFAGWVNLDTAANQYNMLVGWGASGTGFKFGIKDDDLVYVTKNVTETVKNFSIAKGEWVMVALEYRTSDSAVRLLATPTSGQMYTVDSGLGTMNPVTVEKFSIGSANGNATSNDENLNGMLSGFKIFTSDGFENNAAVYTALGDAPTLLVPEPATATLSLLALAGLAARRRRK